MKIRIKTLDSECSGTVTGRTLRWLYVTIDKRSYAFSAETGVLRSGDWRIANKEMVKALDFVNAMGEEPSTVSETAAVPIKPAIVIPILSKDDRLAMIAKSARRIARRA
jgi:hypothetical protein